MRQQAIFFAPSQVHLRAYLDTGTLSEIPDKSVFIEYLIQRLEDNEDKYATSQDLFTRLRKAVINNSP
jgi:hypothetical protein